MLLSFAVQGFRCFADRATLSLTSPALKTNLPRKGQTWVSASERVAAIYGANAAGKTTVLEAIWALSQALRNPGDASLRQSVRSRAGAARIEYEVEFVAEGVRHAYEVHVEQWGIAHEALYAYPKGPQRMLFQRSQAGSNAAMVFEKGASLTGPSAEVLKLTKPDALYLAMARRYNHTALARIARPLVACTGINFVSFRDKQDEAVLKRVLLEMLTASQDQLDLVNALLRAADVGLRGVEVHTDEVPREVIERLERVMTALRDEDGDEGLDFTIPRVSEVFSFEHSGAGGNTFKLPLQAESAGTLTWLTTAWHAVDALHRGSILLVDELDASLHPELARYIVELFVHPEINHRGAQLIFTTHDVSLLGNAPTKLLEPRLVWFVEKNVEGESELFSQADFDNRAGNNSEKRYLAGQFGATPSIDDADLMSFFMSATSNRAIDVAV